MAEIRPAFHQHTTGSDGEPQLENGGCIAGCGFTIVWDNPNFTTVEGEYIRNGAKLLEVVASIVGYMRRIAPSKNCEEYNRAAQCLEQAFEHLEAIEKEKSE